LIVAKADTKVAKGFWKHLGTSGGNVRMTRDDQIEEVLGVKKSSVNIFSVANDTDNKIQVVIDKRLMGVEDWHFHPLVNTATLELRREDVLKFLDSIGRKYVTVDLEEEVQETEKPAAPQKKVAEE